MEHNKGGKNTIIMESYRDVVEQSYGNLTDLFHFLEEGKILKELTSSEYIKESFKLLLSCEQYQYLSIKIFTKIAAFFKEMSADNSHCHLFYSAQFKGFVEKFFAILNPDNCEFVTNLI